VSLCLAIQKPSEREFFVPAGTDLGVKLLTPIGAYMRQLLHRASCELNNFLTFCPLTMFDS